MNFDKNKLLGKTNISTGGGIGLVTMGVTMLQSSVDTKDLILSGVLIVSGIGLMAIKESNTKYIKQIEDE